MARSSSLGDAVEWLGVTYRTILRTDATGGALCIVDSTSPPNSGPPRHIHHNEDETFIILTGRVRLWIEGDEQLLQPGETGFVPRGKEHTFKVVGEEPCRHYLILAPGGFEGFFSEMAKGQFSIPDDMPAIEDSARRFHLSFTGPPLP